MSLKRNSEILLFIRYEKEDFFAFFKTEAKALQTKTTEKKSTNPYINQFIGDGFY